jgi:translocator assembly and maintenance protein 41
MNFDGILQSLPPCDFAFAYGSGVFEQKGYENAKQAPMVDLVIATNDSAQWHAQNLQMNSSHYSMIGRLGGPTLAHVQDDFGAGLYYNTLVSL